MKKRIYTELSPIWALMVIVSLLLIGCEENPTSQKEETSTIVVEDIFLNPKAALPGDTLYATAVVTGTSANVGNFAAYDWSADGGLLLERNLSRVRWVAPDSAGLFTLTVRASNDINTSEGLVYVFVRTSQQVVAEGAGKALPVDGTFYYLSSGIAPGQPGFTGFGIDYYSGAGSEQVVTIPGMQFDFSPGRQKAAFVSVEYIGSSANPINVVLADLSARSWDLITSDGASPLNRRRYQHTYPDLSPDSSMVAYQAFHPDETLPQLGGVDTFDVYVYNVDSASTQQVTSTGNNLFPSFSSDGSFLVFFSDLGIGGTGWELFAYPVSEGRVDNAPTSLVQLTASAGTMAKPKLPPPRPFMAWSPDPANPLLAVVDVGGKLWLVDPRGSAERLTEIAEAILDGAWSRDGSKLAVAAGNAVYLVDAASRATTEVHRSSQGDLIKDLAWAPDMSYLTFVVERAGKMWTELIDLTGGLVRPVALMKEESATPGEEYRSYMDLGTVALPGDRLLLLSFAGSTPGLEQVSIAEILSSR